MSPRSGSIFSLQNLLTFISWLDKAARACRDGEEEYRPCPSAQCSWGCFFSTKEDGNIFTCQMCKYRWCVICEVPMHEDETCGAFQKVREDEAGRQARVEEEERLTLNALPTLRKLCPECSRPIEKNGGCDHMTCQSRRHEFCWLCFSPFNGPEGIKRRGNEAHQETCAPHSLRLPVYVEAEVVYD